MAFSRYAVIDFLKRNNLCIVNGGHASVGPLGIHAYLIKVKLLLTISLSAETFYILLITFWVFHSTIRIVPYSDTHVLIMYDSQLY